MLADIREGSKKNAEYFEQQHAEVDAITADMDKQIGKVKTAEHECKRDMREMNRDAFKGWLGSRLFFMGEWIRDKFSR